MKLPTWAKVVWWALLVFGLGAFLSSRSNALVSGVGTGIDALAFVLFSALLLAPLFVEISMFGITLKQQIDDVKGEVASLRNDVRAAVDFRAVVSPQINMYPGAPPDAQLPIIEERIKAALADFLPSPKAVPAREGDIFEVSSDVRFLIFLRHSLEKELRRIGAAHDIEIARKPVFSVLDTLIRLDVIDASLARAVREAYRVCAPAVHGDEVTLAQIEFARDVGPTLLQALRGL